MPIIGNPWAQDASQFGQQTGNALAQALIQLPQQRYMMALQNAQMGQQRQQQQAMMGLRQQGLENVDRNAQMANEIRMLAMQLQGQHNQAMEQRPINMGGGNMLVPGGGGQQGLPTQQVGTNAPVPQPQPQQPQQQNYNGFQLMQAPRQMTPMTENQNLGNQLKGLQLYGMGSSVTNDPAVRQFLMNTSSNIVQRLRQPQQTLMPPNGNVAMGLSSTNQMGQTNRVFNYNPVTGQLE